MASVDLKPREQLPAETLVDRIWRQRVSMLCIQIGSPDNPCRCKIVGPTLGFIVGVVLAVICWPAGIIVWCCDRALADRLFATPINAWTSVAGAIPF